MTTQLKPGVAHEIPADMRDVLLSSTQIQDAWNDLTELARNEWICWTISVKKEETRKKHLTRLQKELPEGKRRPCCWPGCTHR